MFRGLSLKTDATAIAHNLLQIKRLASNQKILAMVKADAYGHGIAEVLPGLKQADALGVACLEEALQIRALGYIQQPIFLMEGFFADKEIELAKGDNIIPVIHSTVQLDWIVHNKSPMDVWLKIDTGMNRLGFIEEELADVIAKIKKFEFIKLLGVMSHFSDAEKVTNPKTNDQIRLFNELKARYFGNQPLACSLANSAAILAYPEAHGNWLRPGLMLYGVSPFLGKTGMDHGLLPAMTLTTKLIAIKTVKQSQQVGYGSQHVCEKDTLIGIAAIGYGDGYPRSVPTSMPVIVKKTKTRVLGNVSMDMLAVDLTPVENPSIGDEVILWGENLPLEEVACSVGMIPYELLTSLKPRAR